MIGVKGCQYKCVCPHEFSVTALGQNHKKTPVGRLGGQFEGNDGISLQNLFGKDQNYEVKKLKLFYCSWFLIFILWA